MAYSMFADPRRGKQEKERAGSGLIPGVAQFTGTVARDVGNAFRQVGAVGKSVLDTNRRVLSDQIGAATEGFNAGLTGQTAEQRGAARFQQGLEQVRAQPRLPAAAPAVGAPTQGSAGRFTQEADGTFTGTYPEGTVSGLRERPPGGTLSVTSGPSHDRTNTQRFLEAADVVAGLNDGSQRARDVARARRRAGSSLSLDQSLDSLVQNAAARREGRADLAAFREGDAQRVAAAAGVQAQRIESEADLAKARLDDRQDRINNTRQNAELNLREWKSLLPEGDIAATIQFARNNVGEVNRLIEEAHVRNGRPGEAPKLSGDPDTWSLADKTLFAQAQKRYNAQQASHNNSFLSRTFTDRPTTQGAFRGTVTEY